MERKVLSMKRQKGQFCCLGGPYIKVREIVATSFNVLEKVE